MTTELLDRTEPVQARVGAPLDVDATGRAPEPVARRWWPLACLAMLVVLGAVVRAGGFTAGGLWRDDAWVALSSRVGIGTAWHMWATAPGFYFVERSWIVLHTGSTLWDQVVPFVLGIAAIPAAYALARLFMSGRRTALCCALVVAMSPVCLVYSTRLKEYGADFVLACALLAVAEAARRRPSAANLLRLGGVSVFSFAVSASTVPVIAAVWIATGFDVAARRRGGWRAFGLAGGGTLAGCLALAKLLYAHLSPRLQHNWSGFYIDHGTLGAFVSSAHERLLALYSGLAGTYERTPLESALMFGLVSAFLVLGASKGRAMLAPSLVLVLAFGAAVMGRIPIGTGRTDEVLYPAMLLLGAAGLTRVRSVAARLVGSRPARQVVAGALALVAVASVVNYGVRMYTAYPVTDVRTLAGELQGVLQPGDHIVVRGLMRYPWALYEDDDLKIRFGPAWPTGFTVANTEPKVFITPSATNEGDVELGVWADELSDYRRLWFVGVTSISKSPLFKVMRDEGWHAVETLHATGCEATLVVR